MSAKHSCTSTSVSSCSTSRLTDCAKMQAKLIVREVKVFNCWGLHPYTLSDREPRWGFQSNPQTSSSGVNPLTSTTSGHPSFWPCMSKYYVQMLLQKPSASGDFFPQTLGTWTALGDFEVQTTIIAQMLSVKGKRRIRIPTPVY